MRAEKLRFLAQVVEASKKYPAGIMIGGSLALVLRGVDTKSRDVDLLGADEQTATEIFETEFKYLSKKPRKQVAPVDGVKDDQFKSSYFKQFSTGLVDVDLFSNYNIRNAGKWYSYEPDFADSFIDWEGMHLPVAQLEDWYVIYQLIGTRAFQVGKLEKHFEEHKPEAKYFQKWLEQGLPSEIEQKILRYT